MSTEKSTKLKELILKRGSKVITINCSFVVLFAKSVQLIFLNTSLTNLCRISLYFFILFYFKGSC